MVDKKIVIDINENGEINAETFGMQGIECLNELAQKGYISVPEYYFDDIPKYDKDGNPKWTCECTINSEEFTKKVYANSKKMPKNMLLIWQYVKYVD